MNSTPPSILVSSAARPKPLRPEALPLPLIPLEPLPLEAAEPLPLLLPRPLPLATPLEFSAPLAALEPPVAAPGFSPNAMESALKPIVETLVELGF